MNVLAEIKPYQIEVAKIECEIRKVMKNLVDVCLENGYALSILATSAYVDKESFHQSFIHKCPQSKEDCLQICFMSEQLDKAKQVLKTIKAA